jgi:hypothetical protein
LPALLPFGCPNVKPDMVALGDGEVECRERRAEVWDEVLVVASSCLRRCKLVIGCAIGW